MVRNSRQRGEGADSEVLLSADSVITPLSLPIAPESAVRTRPSLSTSAIRAADGLNSRVYGTSLNPIENSNQN